MAQPAKSQLPKAQWTWGDTALTLWSNSTPVSDLIVDLDSRCDKPEDLGRKVKLHLREGRDSPEDLFEERDFEFCGPAEAVEALRRGAGDELAAIGSLDRFRQQRAAERREAASAAAWPPPPADREKCGQCFECGSPATQHCHFCGLALCTMPSRPLPRCLLPMPRLDRDEAPAKLSACRRCFGLARRGAERWAAEREARADGHRALLAAKIDSPCLAAAFLDAEAARPAFEKADDCSGCGRAISTGLVYVPGTLRHHCRACGRSLCALCLCGSITCPKTPTCPHKVCLPQYGYTEPQPVCLKCLPVGQARASARDALDKLVATSMKWANHCERVVTYVTEPESLPKYKADFVDTTKDKAVRAGSLAVSGVRLLSPFLSPAYAMGVNAIHAAWNYGQYGLVGLFCSDEIVQGITTLRTMSQEVETLEPKQLVVGALYLSSEQRRSNRSTPGRDHELAMAAGRPLDRHMLELLIDLAGIGMHAPYEDKPHEAQRLAAQQNWRLVTHRLDESSKHQPAWCLYIHEDKENKMACIAVRGTDLEKSLGGDLFTDVNAVPERAVGSDGVEVVAHSGILGSARRLEPELRQALRALAAFDYQIVLVGHSLGAGVVALLMWLLKHGADGERLPAGAKVFGVGYATPSCLDRKSSEQMKPFFTAVVNSVDVVPRLTVASVRALTEEILECAQESKHDLSADVESIADRVASVWAPKMRTGPSPSSAPRAPPPPAPAPALAPSDVAAAAVTEPAPAAAEAATEVAAAAELSKGAAKKAYSVGGMLKGLARHTLSSLDLTPETTPAAVESAFASASRAAVVDSDLASGGTSAKAPGAAAEAEAEAAVAAGSTAGGGVADIAEEVGGSSASSVPQDKDKSFKQERSRTKVVEAAEETSLWVPGGAESVNLAWFGNANKPWSAKEGTGCLVTEEVKKHIGSNNMLHVSIATLGDPCPRVLKKLFLLVDVATGSEELFCPGAIVWLYRNHGSLRAATVPCDLPVLRRIRCDRRCLEDHGKVTYYRALLMVHARELVQPKVRWQSFADAGQHCPCCHSKYDWQSTTESEKQRWVSMTNCRSCGQVVCQACAQTRLALPELGIPDPARVCDRCVWRGPGGGAALRRLPELLAACGGGAAAGSAGPPTPVGA